MVRRGRPLEDGNVAESRESVLEATREKYRNFAWWKLLNGNILGTALLRAARVSSSVVVRERTNGVLATILVRRRVRRAGS